MKFVAATIADIGDYGDYTRPDPAGMPRAVAAHLARQIYDQLGMANPADPAIDLAIIFLSTRCAPYADVLVAELHRAMTIKTLIGCSAENVIGPDSEHENEAAITLVAAQLPQVKVTPFYLRVNSVESWNDMMDTTETFRTALAVPDPPALFVLLADPFSAPVESLLEAFNTYYPGVPVVGGLASSAHLAGENALIINHQTSNVGAVGLALSGALTADVVVSQGCRPIGPTYKVTGASEDLIFSLNGGSPLKQVQAMVDELAESERALLNNGLFIGRAVRKPEGEEALGRGDFLIRAVMGVDQTTGALSVSDQLKDGEIVRFHVRDAKTAQEDLELLLVPQAFSEAPAGALLFSCNGRGLRLFDQPNSDIRVIQDALVTDGADTGSHAGQVPLAGFFCAGEFGPIGGRNFLHSHTASLVLFRPVSLDSDSGEQGQNQHNLRE